MNIKQKLSKTIAAKRLALESLPLYHSIVTYTLVVKGKDNVNSEEDNVSSMTELSKESNKIAKKSVSSKIKSIECSDQSEVESINDNSSIWLKESVVKQIKELSAELEKEKKEREIKRRE